MTAKSFIDQLNDIIAPMTRAYSDPIIKKATICPGDIQEDYADITLVVRVRRTPNGILERGSRK